MQLLVIVDYLDLPGVAITPDETDPPSLVDANAMLPKPVAAKGLRTVAGRYPQIVETASRVDCNRPGPSPFLDLHGQPANGMACEDGCRALAGKALDHESDVTIAVTSCQVSGKPAGQRSRRR